jgi:hypothetical protein
VNLLPTNFSFFCKKNPCLFAVEFTQAVIAPSYLPTYKETYVGVEVSSFACPFFPLHAVLSLFVAKNVISFDFFTNIHYKLTIFYLSIGKVLFVRLRRSPIFPEKKQSQPMNIAYY